MSFWDFLKGLLPDALIKVNIDNRKIEIKDNKIVFGGNEFADRETREKLLQKILELKNSDSFPFQLLHDELTDDFIEYEDIVELKKEDILLLKSLLPQEDVECILMARRVHLAYSKQDAELVKNLKDQLDKNYPKNGRKIFNLISAGYFDELIVPFAKIKNKEFYKFYKEILQFFPIAIFVGNRTTEEQLEKEFLRRLKLKGIPFIRVHAVGSSNIKKVENVIPKHTKGYSVNNQKFSTTTQVQAQIYEVRFDNKN